MKKLIPKLSERTAVLRILIVLALVLAVIVSASHPAEAACGTTNIALNKVATSSSSEAPGTVASNAVDGNATSRWGSTFSDPQWIQVDLGSTQSICRVVLRWEAAYGKSYQIQTSNDATNWTNIYTTTTGDGGVDDLTVNGSGRYVRMYGTVRALQYGYSLFEFEVYAGTNTTVTPSPTSTKTNTPTATATTGTPTGCGTTNIALNKTVLEPEKTSISHSE